MSIIFIPVVIYFESQFEGKAQFIERIEGYINEMRKKIPISDLKENFPLNLEDNNLIILFTNDTRNLNSIILESQINPKRIFLMGKMVDGGFLECLDELGISGLITSSAIQKWYRYKISPEKRPVMRAVIDYGLFGRKEAFKPLLFNEDDFDIYGKEKYGYFRPLDQADELNLESNLLNFATQWLSFLNDQKRKS